MKVTTIIVHKNKDITKDKFKTPTYKKVWNALPVAVSALIAGDIVNAKMNEAIPVGAIIKTMAAGGIGDGPITNAFMKAGMPILYDLGTVIFICTCTFGFYAIIRKQVKQGVERLKWAAVGFIGLKSLELFIKLVNIAVSTALKNAG